MSDIHDIVRRLEAGEVSRELDLDIGRAVGDIMFPPSPPNYSTSLDAAAALHERIADNWTAIEVRSRAGRTRFSVDISREDADGGEEFVTGRAPTEPAARTAAILKAWAAQQEGQGDG